jgi:hypothetical protein
MLEGKEKKKPIIDYYISDDGKVVDASVDGKTHFIARYSNYR